MPTSPPSGDTGIYVSTSFFPMSWLLLFCKPTIVIDGTPHRRSWGVHFFPLRPGRHTVEISYRYFFIECGPAEEDLQLREGRVHRLFYFKAPMMFSAGSLYDAGPGPMPTISANIILAWVLAAFTALILAVPALCCGGGLIVSAFQAAMRQTQEKADRADRDQKEKEFERDEAERKRVAAEEDAARQKDLNEKQERIARTDFADDFIGRLNGARIDAAYDLTSAGFRQKTDRKQFGDLAEKLGLAKERAVREPGDEQPDGAGGFRHRFTVYHRNGVRTKITLTVVREDKGWKVDQLDSQDQQPDPRQEVEVALAKGAAAIFLSFVRANTKMAYGSTSAGFRERLTQKEFDDLVADHSVLKGQPEFVEGKAMKADGGTVYECRFKGPDAEGKAVEFTVTVVKDPRGYKVDRLTFDGAAGRVNP